MCAVFALELGLLGLLRVPEPDTFAGIVAAAGVFLLMVFSAMPVANRVCRRFTGRLVRK